MTHICSHWLTPTCPLMTSQTTSFVCVQLETIWIKPRFNWLKCIQSACHLAPDHSSSEGRDETAVVCHMWQQVCPQHLLVAVTSGLGRESCLLLSAETEGVNAQEGTGVRLHNVTVSDQRWLRGELMV
ncbi:unnamed protein product [Arctogadus glacialis]